MKTLSRSLKTRRSRQPLKMIQLVTKDQEEKRILREMEEIIREELNVKEVVFRENEEDLVEYRAKANFKILGKELGKDMKEAAEKIEKLKMREIQSLLEGSTLSLDLSARSVDLTSESIIVQRLEKEHPKDAGNMDYITTWAQSMIMAEILRVALDNVGYDALAKGDAEAWALIEKEGIQKLMNYQVGGLHGPVSYVPGDNRLSKSVRVFQVQGGEIKPLTDWIDAPVVEYEKFEWFGN